MTSIINERTRKATFNEKLVCAKCRKAGLPDPILVVALITQGPQADFAYACSHKVEGLHYWECPTSGELEEANLRPVHLALMRASLRQGYV